MDKVSLSVVIFPYMILADVIIIIKLSIKLILK